MRIAIVSDAWKPQVNGVVKTLQNSARELRALNHDLLFITPDQFNNIPCPTYSSIRLALFPWTKLKKKLKEYRPDAIHIATEGPLGHAGRQYCLRQKLPFTTSWHTQFPEYVRMRLPIPLSFTYRYLRHFHYPAERTLVATRSVKKQLRRRGFKHLTVWSRGVDTQLFHPDYPPIYKYARPVSVYMGRVAVEKNIEAYLDADIPGSKVVIGDGPHLEKLRQDYPHVVFLGEKRGEDLAAHVTSADVFVFPSLTDTFGLVLLEAMACGVPVAAYPVQGPKDVIKQGVCGIMDDNLEVAIQLALRLDRSECVHYAANYTWKKTAEIFLQNLAIIDYGNLEAETGPINR